MEDKAINLILAMRLPTPKSTVSDAPWPQSLRSHPIFEVPAEFSEWERRRSTRKSHMLYSRFVAIGTQLRIASLVDARAGKPRTFKVSEQAHTFLSLMLLGIPQTLHTPNVQFEVEKCL